MELNIIQNKIDQVRGVRVMLDFDLAELYQVETRVLKQTVRRNLDRFPEDFMFELTEQEHNSLIIRRRLISDLVAFFRIYMDMTTVAVG